MESLSIPGPQGLVIDLSDERQRAGRDAPAGAFASVTITSDDEAAWSQGEFFTREQALAAHAWLTLLLTDD